MLPLRYLGVPAAIVSRHVAAVGIANTPHHKNIRAYRRPLAGREVGSDGAKINSTIFSIPLTARCPASAPWRRPEAGRDQRPEQGLDIPEAAVMNDGIFHAKPALSTE
jgi:hypothetical protein